MKGIVFPPILLALSLLTQPPPADTVLMTAPVVVPIEQGKSVGGDAWMGQIIIIVLSLISTTAMLWKTGRDQKHSLDMVLLQHRINNEDATLKAQQLRENVVREAEVVRVRLETSARGIEQRLEAAASQIKERVDGSAREVRDRLDMTAKMTAKDVKQEAVVVLATQTEELKEAIRGVQSHDTALLKDAIDTAKVQVSEKADAAYHEANTVNQKLEKLHKAHEAQGLILQKLLESIQQTGTQSAATTQAAGATRTADADTDAATEASKKPD